MDKKSRYQPSVIITKALRCTCHELVQPCSLTRTGSCIAIVNFFTIQALNIRVISLEYSTITPHNLTQVVTLYLHSGISAGTLTIWRFCHGFPQPFHEHSGILT
jgi:hypothetical protein